MSVALVSKYRVTYDYLSGAERAWAITNAVALELGGGWGLIIKPNGMNYKGYSIDCLVNRDTAEFVDCLVSSEEEARPTWQNRKATDEELSAWHAPIGTVIPDPEIPPTPTVPTVTDTLTSSDGRCKLVMQSDGNLVIYKDDVPIWDKNTPRE